MKSHSSQNLIKQKDMNLKILGRMVLDIIRILAHNPYENNLIIRVKSHNPTKGEKGHWKGEKDRQG